MPGAYVYMLRCVDGSLYTGWTVDVERRLAAHKAGTGSRYTRSRLPVAIAASSVVDSMALLPVKVSPRITSGADWAARHGATIAPRTTATSAPRRSRHTGQPIPPDLPIDRIV